MDLVQRPFVEYGDLRPDAQRGREITAETLLERFTFGRLRDADLQVTPSTIEDLASAIHECERHAVARGWTVVPTEQPRQWLSFDQLPEVAKSGRRSQARYLLSRFNIVRRD